MIGKYRKAQTVVILLIFATITVIVTTAAIMTAIGVTNTASRGELGQYAYYISESGIENALLRLLRDPSYTGEAMSVGNGQAVITVSGTNPITVTSVGSVAGFSRRISVNVQFSSGVMSVLSWQEQ